MQGDPPLCEGGDGPCLLWKTQLLGERRRRLALVPVPSQGRMWPSMGSAAVSTWTSLGARNRQPLPLKQTCSPGPQVAPCRGRLCEQDREPGPGSGVGGATEDGLALEECGLHRLPRA